VYEEMRDFGESPEEERNTFLSHNNSNIYIGRLHL
jgi:hypothetical protein